ncbi:MAG: DUF4105 domain-containing protein [Pseudomonadota bacterium]
MKTAFKYFRHVLFCLLIAALTAWTATAFYVHLSGLAFYIAATILGLAGLAIFATRFWSVKKGWIGFALILGAIVAWYQTIRPSHDRDWAPEIAHILDAQVEGEKVTLHNVRDFHWIDDKTAEHNWISEEFDLSKIQSVDMITSVWDSPDIAHLLVSFGFEDQDNIVFSVEIRKEVGESFSTLGGFFRQFEIALVAATEEDILKLRTNHREEDVKLFPVDITTEQQRDLFLSYVKLAQEWAEQPTFYHTITGNCTTTVARLARVIKPDLKFDKRMILSGRLPSLVADLGGFEEDLSIEERMKRAEITAKALALGGSDYSAGIRAGM